MTKLEILRELEQDDALLLLIPSNEYNSVVLENIRQLAKEPVCYVTLNKTFASLKETFEQNDINTKNIVFVDAISQNIKKVPKQTKGCYYVSAPNALTEMAIAIVKVLRHNFKYLVFDSISSLLVYQKNAPAAKFTSSIVNNTKANKAKAVFYAIKSAEHEKILNDIGMFVDRVVDLSK
ncbi:MAG: hypothetical protein JW772_05400 [Candidatus Diapherotrites archaeon]|nr:hypothetical protein [Candidatus Diapherotrites archaeon]